MYETGNEGIFTPWLSDPDACVSCGKCAAVCSSSGIAMTTHVEEAKQRFLTKRPKGLVAEDEKKKCKVKKATSHNTNESDAVPLPESRN
ncbi:MAG: hypothetical protein M1508_01115 [Nitrospirae bacterium]|nr:hypothetical protein [Nitrospirota bacterium]MCL5421801.1 hypothetical protein [Nitrospirota bacterium]